MRAKLIRVSLTQSLNKKVTFLRKLRKQLCCLRRILIVHPLRKNQGN
ncbi:hypothetical protein EMIT036CA2_11128 [Chryseobacterium sp. IT-36CA2]